MTLVAISASVASTSADRVRAETVAWFERTGRQLIQPVIARQEADELQERLATPERVHFLVGAAGGGKTAVLQQTVAGLLAEYRALYGIPYLDIAALRGDAPAGGDAAAGAGAGDSAAPDVAIAPRDDTERMAFGAWAVVTGASAPGVTGTLRNRFFTAEAAAGRGWVHAKTGTLREVSSLSGWTVARDGQPVVLVLMVNGSTNDWFARVWIDQVAATVTACGCR